MKISLNWLNQYIDLKDFYSKPEKLAELITSAGLEVENLENQAQDFANVVTGKIVELGKHPDADKLTLCQVDIGSGEMRQIVCGARNHKSGDSVVVALPGAVLPGGFAIKKSKIRGVESLGMLCSEVELGLAQKSDGIMILPDGIKVGVPFAEYQGLNDILFELSVTPNRADCLSHYGLARELSALLNTPLMTPDSQVYTNQKKSSDMVELNLRAENLCPRYAGRAIWGVKVGPSPDWLKKGLEKIGLNSINNIVDVTNYVMMELGQPLHAFDANFLADKKIIVDRAISGEKFTTLDGTELVLSGEELTIRDGQKAIALAGIVGGKNSGVNEKTTDIFLESAYFTAAPVRKTSRKLGIQTDSSYRFSRGTDPWGVELALNRACHLIQKVAGGEVAESYWDEYPQPIVKPPITITRDYLEQRLGYSTDFDEFVNWMKRLGCQVELDSLEGVATVNAPVFRWDLWTDIDLVEEFGRLNGYDKIPEKLPPISYEPLTEASEYSHQRRINSLAVREGFSQAINFNFVSKSFNNLITPDEADERTTGLVDISEDGVVQLANPLSEDFNIMRRRVFTGLFKNLIHNYRHGSDYGRLFETGHVFWKNNDEYQQRLHLGLIAWGQKKSLWQKEEVKRPCVFDVKSAIENILVSLNLPDWQWKNFPTGRVPKYLHPYQSATLFVEGRVIGFIGSVHPSRLESFKIRETVAMGELDLDKLMRNQPRQPKVKAISKFPSVTRDYSFVLSREQKAADLVQKIRKVGGGILQSVLIFDEFKGGHLKEGERSVSLRISFQDLDGTLDEAKLDQLQNKILEIS